MKTVTSIQVLRAIAALSVALSHFGIAYWNILGGVAEGPAYPFSAGVDLFFVISGFIMVYSSEPWFGKSGASIIFMRHRLVRIVPIYWITMTAWIFLSGDSANIHDLLCSYFFIPYFNSNGINPIYGVGWTLNFEMLFYVIFSFCLCFRKTSALTFLATFMLAAIVFGEAGRASGIVSALLRVWTDPLILEFLTGAFIAILYQNGVIFSNIVRIALISGSVIAIFHFHAPETRGYRWPEWGIPASLIVASAVLGTQRWTAGLMGVAAIKIGDASYSLYLLHGLTLRVAEIFVHNRSISPSGVAALLTLTYGATVILALAAYRYFERPLTQMLKTRPPASAPAAVV